MSNFNLEMLLHGPGVCLALLLILAIGAQKALARDLTKENGVVKSAVYLSPKLTLEPGSVTNKYFYNIDFPRGHLALKNLFAEVVDEAGKSVPLHETYLHHWVVVRYYISQGAEAPTRNVDFDQLQPSDSVMMGGNNGVCRFELDQTFGLGSETRKTATYIPHPYGIEVGNPDEIPLGYEEQWQLNVHAIDTRGAHDKLGCIECRCNLYNVTMDEYGQLLNPNYEGGLHCCYDKTQCRVKEGFQSVERSLYMRYTVEWMDWDNDSIIPVKVYFVDVTDTWKKKSDGSTDHHCKIEYDIESCSGAGAGADQCVDTERLILSAPSSGDIIYGVGHQHTGGIGTSLYREDGRVLCSSVPIYGEGNEVGNEAGYIVGMSTCYPRPGSVKITKGETIVLESNYSSAERHTGVMGLFYLLVAESPASQLDSLSTASTQIQNKSVVHNYLPILVISGVMVAATITVFTCQWRRRPPVQNGYESIVI